MERNLEALQSKPFDILVVGGGIYGAALLRDAAAQGLSAALVEQADYVSGTSANSLKIIHGGLRYLQQADLPRVFESIRERSLLLRTAPHLVAPFPCLMPTTRALMKSRLVMWAGLLLNDILSWNRNAGLVPSRRIPRGRTLSRRALLDILPPLRDTPATGAATWTDAFAYDSERLPLAMIRAATARGALAANYVRADGFLLDDAQKRVLGIRATVGRIDWTVRLPEAHGVRRLRLGDGTLVDLECAARASLDETPRVTVRASRPIPVYVNGAPVA